MIFRVKKEDLRAFTWQRTAQGRGAFNSPKATPDNEDSCLVYHAETKYPLIGCEDDVPVGIWQAPGVLQVQNKCRSSCSLRTQILISPWIKSACSYGRCSLLRRSPLKC